MCICVYVYMTGKMLMTLQIGNSEEKVKRVYSEKTMSGGYDDEFRYGVTNLWGAN